MPKPRYPDDKRRRADHQAAADPDIRGARKGRLGQNDDYRATNRNTPGRVEDEWKSQERGAKRK